MRKTNYFGVKIASAIPFRKSENRFNPKCDSTARFLGDTIIESIRYGTTPSVTIPVTFDDDDAKGVDILASPNHDFFDIADEVGRVVEVQNVPTNGVEPNE